VRVRVRLRRASEERSKGAARLLGMLAIGAVTIALIFGAAYAGGFYLFRMDALDLLRPALSVVFLGALSALVLSSLGHAANAFFSARDLWFWTSAPATAWARFVDRMSETALAAVPATLGLGMVALLGLLFGARADAGTVLRSALTLALVATIPVAVGVIFAHVGGSLLPAGRLRRVTLLALAVLAAVGLAVLRSLRVERIASEDGAARFLEDQRDVIFVGPYWLPNNVGADFAITGELSSFGILVATVGAFALVAYLAHRALFVRARDLADDESPHGLRKGSLGERVMRGLVRFARPSLRPVLEKDLLAFVRDPSQWSQLVLLFGIAVIYIINAQALVKGFEPFPRAKTIIISGMHVGLVTFIAAGLGARFAFPQLGLEGPAVWMLEGSPLSPERVVRAKYLATLPVCCGFPSAVAAIGGVVVGLPPLLWLLTTLLVVVVSASLAAYGVGRGSVAPQFDAISVSELAMGPGALGTMAVAVSLCGLSFVTTMFAGAFLRFGEPVTGALGAAVCIAVPCSLAAIAARGALRRGAEAFWKRREEGSAGTGAFTPGIAPS
jgi:hypothetical protein